MKLAVLLPHYRNIEGLKLTLDSLKKESEPFHLYIIDDGSHMDSEIKDTVNQYEADFPIYLHCLPSNRGITAVLNEGLETILSQPYQYVARVDAGDLNINDRFRKQVAYMDSHPETGLLSSYVRFVDVFGRGLFVFKPPLNHQKLKKVIHVYNPFIHPAVIMRVNDIRRVGFYPVDYPALEDHAYFIEMLKWTKAGIIDEVLLEYEMNPKGISLSKRNIQTASRIKLFRKYFYLGWYPVYGLIRALITKATPRKLLTSIKKILYNQ